MNIINYDVAYRNMVVLPRIEQRKKNEVLIGTPELILSIEKVWGNDVRRVSHHEKGIFIDEFC